MIALSAREEWDYVLTEDRGTAAPTRFRLRPLTLRERNEVEDLIGESIGTRGYRYGTVNTKVLRAGLAGWDGLTDAAGAEVRYAADRDGRVREELLERLPSAACMELANEILMRSTVTAADRKN